MGRIGITSTLIVLALSMALPPASWAQMYRWTDDRGAVHFTQGLESIPERFRDRARLLGYPEQPPSVTPSTPPAMSAELARIPFTPGRPIMVKARINGEGTVDLMLDTGASVTVINPRALIAMGVSSRQALRGSLRGVAGSADVLFVAVESIEVGQAKAGPLRVASHDTGLPDGDGLLGRDFLDRFTVNIDSKAGVVTISPR
jgi:predicted aspartyl protease